MNEFNGVIYKITNTINNKVYIGQTVRKGGFDARYGAGTGNIKFTHNKHLKRSIEKYGVENFTIDKEFDKANSQEELDEKEKYWISYYNALNPNYGYNKKEGGSGGKLNAETKLHILKQSHGGLKPIYCPNTNEVFLCSTDASKKYNISDNMILNMCNNKYSKRRKKFYDKNGKLLEFKWLKNEKKTPVILLNTMESFSSISNLEKYIREGRNIEQKRRFSEILVCRCNAKSTDSIAKCTNILENGTKEYFYFMRLCDYVVANYELFIDGNGYEDITFIK